MRDRQARRSCSGNMPASGLWCRARPGDRRAGCWSGPRPLSPRTLLGTFSSRTHGGMAQGEGRRPRGRAQPSRGRTAPEVTKSDFASAAGSQFLGRGELSGWAEFLSGAETGRVRKAAPVCLSENWRSKDTVPTQLQTTGASGPAPQVRGERAGERSALLCPAGHGQGPEALGSLRPRGANRSARHSARDEAEDTGLLSQGLSPRLRAVPIGVPGVPTAHAEQPRWHCTHRGFVSQPRNPERRKPQTSFSSSESI